MPWDPLGAVNIVMAIQRSKLLRNKQWRWVADVSFIRDVLKPGDTSSQDSRSEVHDGIFQHDFY